MTKPPTCQSCACFFTSTDFLPGPDHQIISARPDHGVCKEGPISVAKNRLDWCVTRYRVRESEAGGRDARVRRAG